jgi:hypothetical protein
VKKITLYIQKNDVSPLWFEVTQNVDPVLCWYVAEIKRDLCQR